MILDYAEIEARYAKHGYRFHKGKYRANLFGFRNADLKADLFNDILGVAYEDSFGRKIALAFEGTTKPGLHYLKNKLGNVKGTFILKPNQYRDVWTCGAHKGYPAYQQLVNGVFEGWRDGDSDGELDYTGPLFTDVHGLNGHHAGQFNDIEKVGPYSAGCQVCKDDKEHSIWLSVGERSAELYSNKFDYTLFQL